MRFDSFGRAFKPINSVFRLIPLAILVSFFSLIHSSHGAILLKPGTTAPGITPSGGSYLQFGEQVANGNEVWIEGRYRNAGPSASTIVFNGILKDASTILTIDLDTHGSGGPIDILRMGTGSNVSTNPGIIRDQFNVLGSDAAYDCSVLSIDPIAGISPLDFASSPARGSIINFASYSAAVISSVTYDDQNIRGGQSKVTNPFPGYDSSIFTTAFVSASAETDLDFPSVEIGGGSGGIVRNDIQVPSNGNYFIGQVVASNGPNGGKSTIYRENTPAFIQWYSSVIPEPTTLSILGLTLIMLRRRRVGVSA